MQCNKSPALAIETSSRTGSIALVENDAVVDEEMFSHGLKHAAELLPMIDRLMKTRGYVPGDLTYVYLSEGPGSFTGLRIGVTLAKTLALVTGVKLVAVPTLRVLAMNAPVDAKQVIVVLDAKRDQIFTSRFERIGDRWVDREPAHLDSLAAMIARAPDIVHLLGDGLPFHEKFIPQNRDRIIITPATCWRPRAAFVAEIGIKMAAAGELTEPDQLKPVYLRKPEAEEKFEMMNAGR